MLESKIYTRDSVDKKSEYQIDCDIIVKGVKSQYRMRRGKRSWTKWFTIRNLELLMWNFGFTQKANLINDFYFENYFERGIVKLNQKMVEYLINSKDEYSFHFYSFVKKFDDTYWKIPVTAIKDKKMFNWLKLVIEENQ